MKRSEVPASAREAARQAQAQVASGFDRVLLYEFEYLEEHLRLAEEKFIGNADEMKRRLRLDLEGMDEDERSRYTDSMVDEWDKIVDSLPRLQWYAQFLVIYSSFEYSLSQLCRIVQKRSKFKLSEKDLYGQGIQRAANYLSKVAGVDTPFTNTGWQHALLLGEIRNCIAHNNGMLLLEAKNKKALSSRLRDIAGIDFNEFVPDPERVQLNLSPTFVRESIKHLQQILSTIANYELYA